MFYSKKAEYVNMSQVAMHNKYFTLGTVKSSLTKFLLPKIVKFKMLHLLSVIEQKNTSQHAPVLSAFKPAL